MKRRGNNEGTFYKRATGTWEYKISVGMDASGKQIRKSFYGKTKGVCLEKYDEFIKNDRVVVEKGLRVGEWADTWLKTYKTSVRANTASHYRSMIEKYIKPSCLGGMRLDSVKPAQVQAVLNDCSEMSQSHQNKLKATLWAIFETAVENDLCRKNPCNSVKISVSSIPKNPEEEYFTIEECEHIKSYCASNASTISLAVTFFLYTGMRRGELLGLQWGDIDLDRSELKIRRVIYLENGTKKIADKTKTPKGIRKLKILPPLSDIIAKSSKDSLFVIPDVNGNFYDPNHFSNAYNRFIKRIKGVRHLGTHAYRHALATHLHAAGVDLRTIQAILGHDDIQTTGNTYTAVDFALLSTAMDKLPY